MKKILFVHNEYGAFSGEEASCYSQYDALKGKCELYSLFISSKNTPVGLLSKIRALLSGCFSFYYLFSVYNQVRKNKIDIVHFHNIYPWLSVSSVIAAKLAGAKVVFSLHNFKHICPSATLSHNGKLYMDTFSKGPFDTVKVNVQASYLKSLGYYLRFKSEQLFGLIKYVDGLVFVSQMQKNVYHSYSPSFLQVKNCVIPNFIKNSDLIKIKQNAKNVQNKSIKKVLFIGRPTPEKGFHEYVELARELPDYDFFVMGSDGDQSNIAGNINFLGKLSREKLLASLKSFDVLVVPSVTYETFSIAALEALIVGLNVIVTDKVGISDYNSTFPNLFVANDSLSIAEILSDLRTDVKSLDEVPDEFTELGFVKNIQRFYGSL